MPATAKAISASPVTHIAGGVAHLHCREGGRCGYFASAYEGQEHDLSLVIMQGNGPALFGREWLAKIRLSWPSIAFHTVVGKRLDEVLQQFKEVLHEELETAHTPSVHLKLKQDSQPKFVPARSVPFALNGLTGVRCYLDDIIIIMGKSTEEHLNHLSRVLERLQNKGFGLKKDKCHFLQSLVEYLGHVIDTNGLHTTPTKQQAIAEARGPTNTSELHSFLGLVNYCGRFLPNVSTILHPLNRLLWKGATWV